MEPGRSSIGRSAEFRVSDSSRMTRVCSYGTTTLKKVFLVGLESRLYRKLFDGLKKGVHRGLESRFGSSPARRQIEGSTDQRAINGIVLGLS
jgi:hypothetical protein